MWREDRDGFNGKDAMMDKITIYGMTSKCHAVLSLLTDRFPGIVDAVVTSRDAGVDNDYYDEIIGLCKRHGIHVYDRKERYAIRARYAVAISWRWLIKSDSARLIVFHDSMLPRYRGFNPLPTALINGDKEVGVTALYATDGYDEGNIIAQSATEINYPIKIKDVIEIINKNYQELAAQIAGLISQKIEPPSAPQKEENVSYSLWRDEEDYFVDWSLSASCIKRFVDAVGYPYRGAASKVHGEIARILDVTIMEDVRVANRTPGKVVFIKNAKPVVVCGEGLLRIDELVDDAGNNVLPLRFFRTRFK